jgi:PIN domain nuclease of toxin-antitoxin system
MDNRRPVLDASALLAYLNDEAGATLVEAALARGASVSAVNWAEVLSKIAARGGNPERMTQALAERGLLGQALQVLPFTAEDALTVAALHPQTQPLGLSLGDRACLGLGLRLHAPVLTADGAWAQLQLDIPIRIIR